MHFKLRFKLPLTLAALLLAGAAAVPAAFGDDAPAPTDAPANADVDAAAPTSVEVDPAAAFEKLLDGADVERAKFGVVVKDGKHYLLVPSALLGRDLLWYAEFGRVPTVEGMLATQLSPGSEIGHRAVRFSRKGKALHVHDLTTSLGTRMPEAPGSKRGPQGPQCPSGSRSPLRLAVCHSSMPPVLRALPIVGESKEGEVLVDADAFFLTDLGSLDPKGKVPGATALASDRSQVETVRAIDRSVEATAVMTYNVDLAALGGMAFLTGYIDGPAATVEVRHTLTLLPDDPMQPRTFDPRVGYFTTAFRLPPARPGDGIQVRTVIARYRLEKKDPTAVLSEPVQPITYYLSEEIPSVWRPYAKG